MNYLKNYITRDFSCLTYSKEFEILTTIENFPVFFGVTNKEEKEDLYAKMEWYIEKETGLIQLNNLIPLEILYQEQHAYGFGETWENHYQEFSKFLLEKNPKNVLEIGGGQGRIANICTQNNSLLQWTIVEPNPTLEESKNIKIHKGFFDEKFLIEGDFDTYTFSHVLEHAYNPTVFLENVFNKMNYNDNLIFSYPNLKAWLSKKFTNSLNFEHTIFLSEVHLDTLLHNIGFNILNKKVYLEHSFFYHLKKSVVPVVKKNYINLTEENTKLLLEFRDFHINEVKFLNNYIDKTSNKNIFLFGAHIFSQYLTVYGLLTNNIICILDNSKEKQGKRLYGTSLKVSSPEILANYKNPIIILRAGPYNEEIKNQILRNINKDCIFI